MKFVCIIPQLTKNVAQAGHISLFLKKQVFVLQSKNKRNWYFHMEMKNYIYYYSDLTSNCVRNLAGIPGA